MLVATTVAILAAVAGLTSPSAGAAGGPLYWIALGDSYSAGVGVGGVGTGCDRDRMAYAPRADRDIFGSSRSVAVRHVACSGATTLDVWADQLPQVTSAHNVATITIGGNDINFARRILNCVVACSSDTLYLRASPLTWDQLYSRLVTTYVNVRKRMSLNGHLYVLSYPIPFSRHRSTCNGFSANEQNAANALVTRLGDTIYLAVQRANELLPDVHGRPGNTHFVDWRPNQSGRITNGYYTADNYGFDSYKTAFGLCNNAGNTPYLNGYVAAAAVDPRNSYNNSFHPNTTGYWRAAQLTAAAIGRHQP